MQHVAEKNRMHVALFNRSFHPDTAATGQLFTELCVGLVQDHQCRVSVIAGPALIPAHEMKKEGLGRLVSRENHRGVHILRSGGTRFSKSHFVGRASNYISYFLSACYAGCFLLERPDVIVAATDPPIIGLAAYLAARRFRVPLVMIYQDIFPEVGRLLEDFHSRLVDAMLQSVNCFLTGKAARNVVLGETMRGRLIEGKKANPQRTVIISNWADCAQIVPSPRNNEFSARHGLDGKFVVMHSGNIGLSQDLGCIIEAADRLRSVEEIHFVIVGDGVKKPSLVQDVQQRGLTNVTFLPYQPKEGLKESFGTADVFMVSLKRGLAGYIVPSKLYGILAAGRPYVAAVESESEVALVTRKHQCGLLAEPGNAEQIADRILTLYYDASQLRNLAANARNAAFEFDRPVQIRRYFNLFRELAPI
jgi:glycosyltransferase involved in cell wall biosynthesis